MTTQWMRFSRNDEINKFPNQRRLVKNNKSKSISRHITVILQNIYIKRKLLWQP